jgi:hypothetical protein
VQLRTVAICCCCAVRRNINRFRGSDSFGLIAEDEDWSRRRRLRSIGPSISLSSGTVLRPCAVDVPKMDTENEVRCHLCGDRVDVVTLKCTTCGYDQRDALPPGIELPEP